jgi:hypothetical protein
MFVRYSPEMKKEWDTFVESSKNGVFLFYRDYMEYHSDRFSDFSLMFYNGAELAALFPANIKDNLVESHGGLTFGGFVTGEQMKTSIMLLAFEELKKFLVSNSVNTLIYKCVPHIYHRLPAEEDRYALFLNEARLYRRDVTATVALRNPHVLQKLRERNIKKAREAGIIVKESEDYVSYWDILERNLMTKHDSVPVHTVAEIHSLQNRFPENIRLFGAYKGGTMLAGVVVYENVRVAHAQYIANSDEGRGIGALDIVFEHLINECYRDREYFDFGISNEKDGRYLNEGLINYKEGFGARAIVHDFYEVNL